MSFFKNIYIALVVNGINLLFTLRSILSIPFYFKSIVTYIIKNNTSFKINFFNIMPILVDRDEGAGKASGHYFHQDLNIAKRIFNIRPEKHLDVGSSVSGFVSHLLIFVKTVNVIDIRKLDSKINGLNFIQGNAINLNIINSNSVFSLSSLHAAEHFGLGRYGDPIDPMGHVKFINELQRILAKDGRLYFSVPVGVERLEFNAHRIFNPLTIIKYFDKLKLLKFSLVNDEGDYIDDADFILASSQKYGCGIFEFTKL